MPGTAGGAWEKEVAPERQFHPGVNTEDTVYCARRHRTAAKPFRGAMSQLGRRAFVSYNAIVTAIRMYGYLLL
jgi:hypothetical protein